MDEELHGDMFGEDLTGEDEFQDIDVVLSPRPSFAVDLMTADLPEKLTDQEEGVEEELLITEPIETHDEEFVIDDEKPKTDETFELTESDFFDQPVIDDEKQKIVEEIEGMTEVAEEVAEEPDEEQRTEERASVQFDDERGVRISGISGARDTVDWLPSPRRSSMSGASASLAATIEEPDIRFPKQSIIRKATIQYPKGARITGWDSEVDELMMGFDELREPQLMMDEIVEEEERVEEEVEEEEPVLDRAPYQEKYDKMVQEIAERKIRSCVLQKLLAMYFKRKKMDYATRESDWTLTLQVKYNRKLETWKEFKLFDTHEREHINQEIQTEKQQRENKASKLQEMFVQMQNREREIGYGLIYKKSGHVIPDKLVDRLLNRQKNQMKEICTMRLNYLKLKQMLHEKLAKMANLDEVSPGFLLANYEQLKVINQSYADKIEERDEELTRLRSKCANTIQILAHIREKSTALDSDVSDLEEVLADTEMEYSQVRMKLNELKQQRDACRHSIVKIRNESGLLTKPTLLRDMQEELNNSKELAHHLRACKQTNKKLAKRIKAIRLKIEEAKDVRRIASRRMTKKESILPEESSSKQVLYKGRPSLIMPYIDPKAFDSLKSIKPQLTYDRRLHDIKCIRQNKGKTL